MSPVKSKVKKGKFIVIDGLGGSGKSTQIELLKLVFPNAVFAREPGGAVRSERIRDILKSCDGDAQDPVSDFFLFWAARAENIASLIRPSLAQGKTVFCDRFDSSTWAMQVRGEKNPSLSALFDKCRDTVLKGVNPDLYIILDIDPVHAQSRRVDRMTSYDRFDERAVDFQTRARNGFLEFAKNIGNKAIVIKTGDGPDALNEQILKILKTRKMI